MRRRGDNHPPPSLRLSFVRTRRFAGGGIAEHGNLPLWRVRREWQATRSEEGQGEGSKGNGDCYDTTINIRWEVGGGRGARDKGGSRG